LAWKRPRVQFPPSPFFLCGFAKAAPGCFFFSLSHGADVWFLLTPPKSGAIVLFRN
jgi:hypothetical protein